MEYTIITGYDIEYLIQRVNTEIQKGWVPLGSAFIDLKGFYRQTMTKQRTTCTQGCNFING